MPKALVIGSRGQDGSYLVELLQAKGYELIPLTRHGVDGPLADRYPSLLVNSANMKNLLVAERPDEIYYLAAFHHSSEEAATDELDLLRNSFETNTNGLLDVLYATMRWLPKTRLFYAASSHIFGEPSLSMQDENTPINPVNAYGISKSTGVYLCRYFRKQHNLHASVGILFNHESPRRADRFLSKKIVKAAINIKQGRQE